MALTLKEKRKIRSDYEESLEGVQGVVILKHFGIPVNQMNELRMDMRDLQGKIKVLKKRLFIKVMKEKGFEDVGLDTLEDSVAAVFLYGEEDYEPLKLIEKYSKFWKKKEREYGVEYVGGWFGAEWKGGDYVKELANLPTREELVGKFAFLMNYPVQSFAFALNQVSEQKSE